MPLKLSSQPEYDFIEYNLKFKRMSGFLVIGFFLFAAAVIILYLSVFRKFEWFQETWFISLLTHIKNEVFSGSSIGMFYACFFGGLFFLFVPLDIFFIAVLNSGKFSAMHLLAMSAGLILSYSINYIIGMRFYRLSKNLVSPKKFYKSKVILNRFGKYAIFFLNLLGFGSQLLSFVLGVFRYNKTRAFVFTFSGQLLRYSIIALAVLGFFG